MLSLFSIYGIIDSATTGITLEAFSSWSFPLPQQGLKIPGPTQSRLGPVMVERPLPARMEKKPSCSGEIQVLVKRKTEILAVFDTVEKS